MAIYLTNDSASRRLIELPESGMGFQVFRFRQSYLVAFNASIVIPLAELREPGLYSDLERFLAENEEERLMPREMLELDGPISLAFSPLDPSIRDPGVGLISPDAVSGPSLSLLKTKRPISYYRFVSTPRDPRVNSNGDFVPGTYATTFSDLPLVPSGFAAVGRYALPNPASARFLFQITTYDRPTFMGTATPNFGQAGGGVEVFFKSGAKNVPGASYMIDAG
jgi:hypothetical protein